MKKINSMLLIILLLFTQENYLYAKSSCNGRFINPITDICWSCILPISIGGINIGTGSAPKKRDTKNPSSPICFCKKLNQTILLPGVAVGFWEPVRIIEVTRTPYCMIGLGGIKFFSDKKKISSFARNRGNRSRHSSFYHVHLYSYPLVFLLELLTDFACLEKGSFDVAYMSEFDISWNDPKIQSLLNPEAALFGNPKAQAACSLDCTAATISNPIDNMFWCAGCWGNMYPLSGANSDFVGGVQNSALLATRVITKLHKAGLALETSTNQSKINGKICKKSKSLKIKKSQYKLQMIYPKVTTGPVGCFGLGLNSALFDSFKEYPYEGEDWSYLLWRKKNCCLF
jgi:conjugal transfer pilus assembly protein TraU